jgi:hypothetical protein
MSNQRRQTILATMAIALAIVLVLFLADRDAIKDPAPPRESAGMSKWLAAHPADWLTAAALSDAALDTSLPRRVELWHASYALANHLAPRVPNPRAAFVRDGLFHWYELEDRDRKAVLDTAAPLLRDPQTFGTLSEPLFDLTHDFDYLLHNAPQTVDAMGWLRMLAATRGLFAQYRETRARVERLRVADFAAQRASVPTAELPALLPRRLTAAEEPLVRQILEEMQQRSFDPVHVKGDLEGMIEYTIAHRLQPLAGVAPFVEESNLLPDTVRARLALALGHPEAASLIELGSSSAGTPAWSRYHLERALFEAQQGNAAAANLQLRRATTNAPDLNVLATSEQCATLLHKDAAAAQLRQQLASLARRPIEWSDTCARNELCDLARASVYSTGNVEIKADVVQSDQTPPYIEIYADDARVAEGEVAGERRFTLPLPRGVHRLEIRLINPRLGNGTQRRVRLS